MTLPRLEADAVRAGPRLTISFQRTLRIPDDGRTYPLPPGLGRFPLRAAGDYAEVLPRSWSGDFFLPIYAREALWIAFEAAEWKPNAVKIAAGGVNVVTGAAADGDALRDDPQNYVVCPEQPWLDGINSGDGSIRQFVAVPLGAGYTIEGQITGAERVGGLQFAAFEPKPGRFPDQPPPAAEGPAAEMFAAFEEPESLGLAVGGTMEQKIYPDPYGLDTWDPASCVSFRVHLLSPAEFSAVTGEPLPHTPADARAYTAAGLPWFALYDERAADLPPAEALQRLRSLRELEERGGEASIDVGHVRRLDRRR